jgi:hypothetical protein
MPKPSAAFDAVRKLGLALADVEEGTAYGSPALKVNGRMFACIASHRSAEPDTLAVRMAFNDRDQRIATAPQTYYLKDHYVNYPCVLVRLGRCNQRTLRELLEIGHSFVSSGANLAPRKVQPRSRINRKGARG